MQFRYYHILWVFLTFAVFIFLFMPSREEAINQKDIKSGKKIPQKEKNGLISSYSSDGKLKTKIQYTNGVKDGISYLYYKDGETVQLEMTYAKGLREGISKKYYQNGKIYAETSYRNNKMNGIRRLYYTTGKIKAEIPYGFGFPGIGLKEYLMGGDLKPSTSIQFLQKENFIYLETSKPCSKAKFYMGKLIDDHFFNPLDEKIKLIPSSGSQFFIDLNVFTPSYLQKQDIICSCKTKQGNPLILKRRIDTSSLKNGNQ